MVALWFARIALLLLTETCFCSYWNYAQQGADWEGTCVSSSRQSPINIETADMECDEPLFLEWTCENVSYAVVNTGHTLQATPFRIENTGSPLSKIDVLNHRNDTSIRLQNSMYNTYTDNVNKEYCFDSLHFHWAEDNAGSEHTVNGQQYALEAHLVHFSCDHYSLSNASDAFKQGDLNESDDGNFLAVISILFEVGEENPALSQLLHEDIVEGVHEHHDANDEEFHPHEVDIFYTQFDLSQLLPQNRQFFAYEGSLTTPPCTEAVRWHIMKDMMTVSTQQLNQVRRLLASTNSTDYIAPNFRPVQVIGDRKVTTCKEDIIVKEKAASSNDEAGNAERDVCQDTWWFTGAVVFMTLFGVAMIVIVCLTLSLMKANQQNHILRAAGYVKL